MSLQEASRWGAPSKGPCHPPGKPCLQPPAMSCPWGISCPLWGPWGALGACRGTNAPVGTRRGWSLCCLGKDRLTNLRRRKVRAAVLPEVADPASKASVKNSSFSGLHLADKDLMTHNSRGWGASKWVQSICLVLPHSSFSTKQSLPALAHPQSCKRVKPQSSFTPRAFWQCAGVACRGGSRAQAPGLGGGESAGGADQGQRCQAGRRC